MSRRGPLIEVLDALPPKTAVDRLRDHAIAQVSQHADQHRAGFSDAAAAFILGYLGQHGPTAGEVLTLRCKDAGITAHDDRAFGGVYMTLSRRGRIVKVGTVRRERGHGTAGGNVWALPEGT